MPVLGDRVVGVVPDASFAGSGQYAAWSPASRCLAGCQRSPVALWVRRRRLEVVGRTSRCSARASAARRARSKASSCAVPPGLVVSVASVVLAGLRVRDSRAALSVEPYRLRLVGQDVLVRPELLAQDLPLGVDHLGARLLASGASHRRKYIGARFGVLVAQPVQLHLPFVASRAELQTGLDAARETERVHPRRLQWHDRPERPGTPIGS